MDTKMKKSFYEKTFSRKEIKSKDENKNDATLEMRRRISDKNISILYKQKTKTKNDDNQNAKSNRFLISINVFGSSGPIRFIANGDDNAAVVIETALKLYARQGRLPILGSDISCFSLYPANTGFDALKPLEAIGSRGVRNFVLCKESKPNMTIASPQVIDGQGCGCRAWLKKSLSLKIISY